MPFLRKCGKKDREFISPCGQIFRLKWKAIEFADAARAANDDKSSKVTRLQTEKSPPKQRRGKSKKASKGIAASRDLNHLLNNWETTVEQRRCGKLNRLYISPCGKIFRLKWKAIEFADAARLANDDKSLKIQRLQKINPVSKFDEAWESRYKELKKYRKIHGDCSVRQSDRQQPQLSQWVMKQRQRHRKNSISVDRKKKLDAIGFIWFPRDSVTQECDRRVAAR